MTLLFHFQAPELLAANEHPDREVPFPLVVLLDALGQVLALAGRSQLHLAGSVGRARQPVPVAAERLLSISRWGRACGPSRSMPRGIAARRDTLAEIARQAAARLQAAWALLQGLRQHAAESIFTWSAKFTCRPGRNSPTRCCRGWPSSPATRACCDAWTCGTCGANRGRSNCCWAKRWSWRRRATDRFRIVGGAMPVEPGGYPEWLLVRDDEAGRRAQLEFRDYACRAQVWQAR